MVKIMITRRHLSIIWIWVATILPYVEIAAVREMFEIKTRYMTIPAVEVIMLLLWIWLFGGNRLHGYQKERETKHYFRKVDLLMFFLIFMAAYTVFAYDSKLSSYIQLGLFVLPYLFAKEVMIRSKGIGLTNQEIVKYAFPFFAITQIIFVIINVVEYGFSFDGNSESRILSVGGGPVILGYTVVLILSCWFIFRKDMNRIWNIMVIAGCLIVAFATGSRGSMWPSVLLIIAYATYKNGKIAPIRGAIVLLIGIILFLFVDLSSLFPRLFLFNEGGRFSTVISNFEAFKMYNPLEVILGKGFGNFYPYQQWNIDNLSSSFFDYNHFSYKGISLLVQPHNSFVYAFMEMGIIGGILYITTIKTSLSLNFNAGKRWKFEYIVFVVFLILVLFVESTFFIATGSASLWWFIIMIVGNSDSIYERDCE